MHKKLEEILKKTKKDLAQRKKEKSLKELKKLVTTDNLRSFKKALHSPRLGSISLIAEIKLSSPSQPFLGNADEVINRAVDYEKAGADAISVVTEKHFFNGDPKFIEQIKSVVSLPVLQKDFIIDPYQVYEAKIAKADAILLIARILSKSELIKLVNESAKLGLEVIVEINNHQDLEKAKSTSTKIIAVNARDLDTFEVDIDLACKLLKLLDSSYTRLGFSGISNKMHTQMYKLNGADGVLIGTNLMKAENVADFIKGVLV